LGAAEDETIFKAYFLFSSKSMPLSVTSIFISLNSIQFTSSRELLNQGNNILDPLGLSLRDILLQECLDRNNVDYVITELILCACNELTSGTSPTSRQYAFEFLGRSYFLPSGKKELRRLGHSGGLLEYVARRSFSK
jgi:hypothetical protein